MRLPEFGVTHIEMPATPERVWRAIRKVPIIAVVHGRALGFGCAIAAACDITLAGDKAKFQVPEMAHNILPTMVMSSFVDRVPRKAMSYLVYSTAEISPSGR